MKEYLNALNYIMENGIDKEDRTGVGIRSVFTYQMRFNLREGFPAVTTKKLAWKSVVSELLWFLEGSGDERRLAEILYNAPRDQLENKKTIWSDNANAPYWKHKAKFEGDLGRIYGVNWRRWTHYTPYSIKVIDQIKNVIDTIKRDPFSRRLIVSAWNAGELDQMALPPCHVIFQFYVNDNKLSCHMFQRIGDAFLGTPFNIASYALLTHMIAQVTNLSVNELIITTGDFHIYHNHFDQVKEQLSRDPYPLPRLGIDTRIKDIDKFSMDSFHLIDYDCHPPIKAQMAV